MDDGQLMFNNSRCHVHPLIDINGLTSHLVMRSHGRYIGRIHSVKIARFVPFLGEVYHWIKAREVALWVASERQQSSVIL